MSIKKAGYAFIIGSIGGVFFQILHYKYNIEYLGFMMAAAAAACIPALEAAIIYGRSFGCAIVRGVAWFLVCFSTLICLSLFATMLVSLDWNMVIVVVCGGVASGGNSLVVICIISWLDRHIMWKGKNDAERPV